MSHNKTYALILIDPQFIPYQETGAAQIISVDLTIRQRTGRVPNVQDGAVPFPDGVATVVIIVALVPLITRAALDSHALLHALNAHHPPEWGRGTETWPTKTIYP